MSSKPIDWSQLWYPGRAQPFSDEEMARAGAERPGRTLLALLALHLVALVGIVMLMAPKGQALLAGTTFALLCLSGSALAWWLWWRPWRGALLVASLGIVAAAALLAWALRELVPDRDSRHVLAVLLAFGGSLLALVLWFLVVWRSHQIEARLAALVEREQAIEMARRLAAAQLEPHFLFNTLASVQHWVDTRDERASTLLSALTGYLRATLPLFRQPTLPLAEELVAVERYLQVMQARLGSRLAWRIDVEPELLRLPLPSGALLTLVENAVEHGIEPQLHGGSVRVLAQRLGAQAQIEVTDDGAGLSEHHAEGVGLANVRQRLALLGGPGAALALVPGPTGGCTSRLVLPASLA